MAASSLLDVCRFNPTAGSTTDWTYSSAVTGYQSPSAAGVVNGAQYSYRAESADLSQWEIGTGTYNTSTGVLSRTTVLFNSSGTTSKINFSVAPQVAIVALKEDLISVEEANSFTATQQAQARSNIGAATSPSGWTRQVFITAGSFTYTTPAGCKAILVKMRGAGSGSSGSGSSNTNGGAGTASSFNSAAITAPGASAPVAAGTAVGATGGVAGIGGDFSIPGENGESSNQQIALGDAGRGGGSGGGRASRPNAVDNTAGATNSGAGGGGAASASGIAATAGGAQGAYTEKLIVSPALSYAGVVGTGGPAGTGSTCAGQKGADGFVIVEEYY